MKNYLNHTLSLALLLLLLLFGLSFLPENIGIGNFDLRKMDILADVRPAPPAMPQDSAALPPDTLAFLPDTLGLPPDTLAPVDTAAAVFVPFPAKDSTVFGRQIEDYSPSQRGLSAFFAAIDSIRFGKTVRVAWYGDSFVEGDILLGDLRDTLQSRWGGQGVGFVPITSEVAQFKRSLKHQFRGWTTYSIIKKKENTPPVGINGYVYRPEPEAKAHYEGADYFRNTRRFSTFRLYYAASQPSTLAWQKEGGEPQNTQLKGGDSALVRRWEWREAQPTRGFAIRFPETEGLLLYGASLENGPGFYLDNFSVRGNSGGPLRLLRPEMAQQFERYDLVVLQVGLNAVTNSLNNVKWYQAELERTFAHLRKCFPHSPILVVSVGDRAGKTGDQLATMRGVPAIVAMQRDMARQHGFLFYDMFRGMGGPGSIIEMAHHRPRYANLDYTHLTHEGGRQMGHLFAQLLLEEQQRHTPQR
jgi:hypothetical protein